MLNKADVTTQKYKELVENTTNYVVLDMLERPGAKLIFGDKDVEIVKPMLEKVVKVLTDNNFMKLVLKAKEKNPYIKGGIRPVFRSFFNAVDLDTVNIEEKPDNRIAKRLFERPILDQEVIRELADGFYTRVDFYVRDVLEKMKLMKLKVEEIINAGNGIRVDNIFKMRFVEDLPLYADMSQYGLLNEAYHKTGSVVAPIGNANEILSKLNDFLTHDNPIIEEEIKNVVSTLPDIEDQYEYITKIFESGGWDEAVRIIRSTPVIYLPGLALLIIALRNIKAAGLIDEIIADLVINEAIKRFKTLHTFVKTAITNKKISFGVMKYEDNTYSVIVVREVYDLMRAEYPSVDKDAIYGAAVATTIKLDKFEGKDIKSNTFGHIYIPTVFSLDDVVNNSVKYVKVLEDYINSLLMTSTLKQEEKMANSYILALDLVVGNNEKYFSKSSFDSIEDLKNHLFRELRASNLDTLMNTEKTIYYIFRNHLLNRSYFPIFIDAILDAEKVIGKNKDKDDIILFATTDLVNKVLITNFTVI